MKINCKPTVICQNYSYVFVHITMNCGKQAASTPIVCPVSVWEEMPYKPSKLVRMNQHVQLVAYICTLL